MPNRPKNRALLSSVGVVNLLLSPKELATFPPDMLALLTRSLANATVEGARKNRDALRAQIAQVFGPLD
jgi:hypothetical protein